MKIDDAIDAGKFFHNFETIKDGRAVGVNMLRVESLVPDIQDGKRGMQIYLDSGNKVFVKYDGIFSYFGWDLQTFEADIDTVEATKP